MKEQMESNWFEAFRQLIAKVSERPSWASFIRVIIVTDFIESLAGDDPELKEQIYNEFIDFTTKHHYEFITNGETDTYGFDTIVDYLQVKKYEAKLELAVGIIALILLYLVK